MLMGQQGKCPAAYHYSCAKANESLKTELWQVEEWLPAILPPDAPPGTEAPLEKVSNVKLELLCPTHNPVSTAATRIFSIWNKADNPGAKRN